MVLDENDRKQTQPPRRWWRNEFLTGFTLTAIPLIITVTLILRSRGQSNFLNLTLTALCTVAVAISLGFAQARKTRLAKGVFAAAVILGFVGLMLVWDLSCSSD